MSWECSLDGNKRIAYRSFLRKHIGKAHWKKKQFGRWEDYIKMDHGCENGRWMVRCRVRIVCKTFVSAVLNLRLCYHSVSCNVITAGGDTVLRYELQWWGTDHTGAQISYTLYISGVPRNFVSGGGGVQQNQLRIEDRDKWDLGAVAP